MNIQADFTGADRKTQALMRLGDAGPKKLLTKFAAEAVKRAKVNASHGILGGRAFRRTSQLMRNIGMKVISSGGIHEAMVGTGVGTAKSVIYGSVHEFGMTIRAKKAKYLRFRTADGRWHCVKQVTIPARHWLMRSIKDVQWMINERELAKAAGFPESQAWE